MTQSTVFVVLLMAISLYGMSYAAVSRPRYIGCVDNSECSPGYCCVLGNNRYSIPACQALQSEGDPCRPASYAAAATLNTTVSYPNGDEVILTGVYSTFCNCGFGLTCDSRDHVCRDESQHSGFNSLLGESSIQND